MRNYTARILDMVGSTMNKDPSYREDIIRFDEIGDELKLVHVETSVVEILDDHYRGIPPVVSYQFHVDGDGTIEQIEGPRPFEESTS